MNIKHAIVLFCFISFITTHPMKKGSGDIKKRADYREKLNRRNYVRGNTVSIAYLAQKTAESDITKKSLNQAKNSTETKDVATEDSSQSKN